MSFLTTFFGFFVHLKAKVSQALVNLFGAQTATELGHAALNILNQTKIGAAVLQYVNDFNAPTFDAIANDVKRLQVVSKVRAFAQEHGITISDSLINLLVEIAVSRLKGYFEDAGKHDPKQHADITGATGHGSPTPLSDPNGSTN